MKKRSIYKSQMTAIDLQVLFFGCNAFQSRHEWKLNKDFEIGKPLGEGKFGHVYLARTAKEKRYVALKVIHSKQIEEDRMEHQINRETDIHIELK